MKDPPPVFSPASQSVTLPSLKSVEIHQAGNRGEQNDRSPLPSNIIIPRSWTRTELERRSLFSLLSASREGEALFEYRERNETKRKKERIEIHTTILRRRRSPWINPCSRSFTVDRSRMNASFPHRMHGETRRENMACERISKCAAYNRTLVNPD